LDEINDDGALGWRELAVPDKIHRDFALQKGAVVVLEG